jgi:hypothetical protein
MKPRASWSPDKCFNTEPYTLFASVIFYPH